MKDFDIKEGQHKGEVAVVVEELENGIKKVLTLGGICYYDADGKEVCRNCLGTKKVRTMWGVIRCQWCLRE